MKRIVALVVVHFALIMSVPFSLTAAGKEPVFVASEMLVKFKLGKEEKGNLEIAKIGAKVKERLATIDVSRLKLPKNLSVEKAVKQFSKLNIVDYAEPNYIQKAVWTPSDTHFGRQWGHEKIRTVKAWAVHTGRSSTIIAIVDTGVDLDHPDLKQKIVKGYDYVDDDDVADDVGGHGTHCAGIAAASTNNKKGVAGVCPNCSIMPVRVLGPDGGSSTDVAKGIVFAADNGAHVISLSLGSYMMSSTILDAVKYAKDKGAILIAASGNDGVSSPHYPAYFDDCMAVGSTDKKDKQSYFSNFGAWVDVAAPGEQIYSTVPGGGYDYKTGTSMAAPHVAGLAGLMFSCPGASRSGVEKAILNSAQPVGDWVVKGRVDAVAALDAVGCSETTAPPQTSPPEKSPEKAPEKAPEKTPEKDDSPEKAKSRFSVELIHGQPLADKDDPLATSDDNRLAFSSKSAGFSSFLDFTIETQIATEKSVKALTLTLEGMTANPGTFEIHFFHWEKGSFQKKTSTRLESADKGVTLAINDAAGFVDGKGRVRIKFFRKEKLWNGFDIGIDQLTVSAAESSPPSAEKNPPPDVSEPPSKGTPEKEEDESLSDKARKTWERFKKKL